MNEATGEALATIRAHSQPQSASTSCTDAPIVFVSDWCKPSCPGSASADALEKGKCEGASKNVIFVG